MLYTVLFLILCATFAAALWLDRREGEGSAVSAVVKTAVPAVTLILAFITAAAGEHGDQLTIKIEDLRVPPATVAASKTPESFTPYLIVGDRSDAADLFVPPYPDQNLARASMPAEARTFMQLEARRRGEGPAEETGLDAQLTLRSFVGQPDAGIPGMGVIVDGRKIAEGRAATQALIPDRPVRIAVARIDPDGTWVERRSFLVEAPKKPASPILLVLDKPMRASAGSCDEPRLRLSPAVADDAADALYRDPRNLVFSGLGRGGAYPVAERQWLGPIADVSVLCAQSQTRVLWPTAVEPEAARLSFTSQKTFLPWYACVYAVLALIAMHLICGSGWRRSAAERVVVPLLQWLLTLRLLVAVAGLYNDSSLILWQVLWDPLAALVCLPVLAVVALRPGGPELRLLMASLATLVLLAFGGLFIASGGRYGLGLPLLLGLGALLATGVRFWRNGEASPIQVFARLIDEVAGELGRRLAGVKPAFLTWLSGLPPTLTTGAALLALLVIARVGLAIGLPLLGVNSGRERLLGVPLSLVYVPMAILSFALMLDGVGRMRSRTRTALMMIGAFIAAYVLVPMVTRDAGMVLLFGIPIGMGIAHAALTRLDPAPPGWTRLLWLAPLAIPPAATLALALGLLLFGHIPDPAVDIGAHMTAVTQWDRNDIRLLGFIAPDRVHELGTKFAFEWLDLATGLGPVTASPVGQGFLTPSHVQASLLTNQYSDNLTAIHIVWPVGRLGALGIPLVLAAAFAALAPPRPDGAVTGPPAWLTTVWFLAGATLLWSSAYMLMANLNWAPFTGRNVYLLAVSSNGDLAEGLVLVLLMAMGLAVARPSMGAAP